jgi:outer membrane protein assembly factor BamB
MSNAASTASDANQQTESGPDPIIGKVIDGCRIQRKLGQGGMGVVYLAEHEALRQQFVIKILNPALVGAEDTVERFFREAQACAQLNHPGIVAIQNVGQEGEYYFIRMEYIEGKTLEDTIKEKNHLEWRHAVQIIVDTAEALSHAHQKGMIHRDIKPENIMMTPQGVVKVMDFGLAKHVHSQAKVSVTGQIVGTPFFMSPEQAGGKPTDARSDIYSLGVTLYYMLTGVKPFNGKNLQEIFLKHFFYAPESPKIYTPDLPEGLCEVVKKCLKKKKKERYQSAKDLVRDLRAVLDDPDVRISADGPSGPETAEAPPADADFGKTIRAQQGPAEAERTQVASRTVQVHDVSGGTVRVEDDGGGATVRVGDDGGGATVRVGGDDAAPTVAVKKDGEATVRLAEDEEHPAAGLDLPTALITQMGLDPSKTGMPAAATGGRAVVAGINRTKLAIVAGIVAVPLLLLGANEVRARSAFEALSRRYDAETSKPTEQKDPAAMKALAADCRGAPGGITVDGARLQAMAQTLDETADLINKRKADEAAAQRAADDAAKRAAAERERHAKRLADATAAQEALTPLLEQKDYKTYTEKALALVAEYGKDVPEVASLVRIPVVVTSDPGGAELVFVDDQGEEAPAPHPRTPGVVMVPPNRDFTIKVRLNGFVEKSVAGTANAYVEGDCTLDRKVFGTLTLGQLPVKIGARSLTQGLEFSSAPAVDVSPQGGGLLYGVTQDGLLRAFSLRGGVLAPDWRVDPKEHKVGVYGDPTPSPLVVPGQVVIVSSLLGRLSAHRPQNNGQLIWALDVGAPVTSSPVFVKVGSEAVVAAGLATGDVVFVAGSQVAWRFHTESAVVSRPFIQGERAFVGSTDGRLYALDHVHQRLLGSLDLGASIVDGPDAIGRELVCLTADGKVHVVDATDPAAMKLRASVGDPMPVERQNGLEVVADRVYATVGKQLRAFVVAPGGVQPDWKAPLDCPAVLTRPVIEGDRVYCGGQNGVLYAVDRIAGQVRWRYPVAEAQLTLPPFVLDQQLFVIAGDRLVVLQAD